MNSESYSINSEKIPRMKRDFKGGDVTKNSTKKLTFYKFEIRNVGFPGGTVVENLPANAGDTGSSPGPGRSHMPQSS